MGQLGTDSRETQRKLSVCKGEEHTLMLNEILKGANVVIAGDSGKAYHILLFVMGSAVTLKVGRALFCT